MERLTWLDTVFHAINPRVSPSLPFSTSSQLTPFQDPEISEVAPRILEVLNQRLEGEYMHIAEADPQSLALLRIPTLARLVRELRAHANR